MSKTMSMFTLLLLFSTAPLMAQAGVDTFEASTLRPFWSVTQQYGTVGLSTGPNHTFGGKQSLKFTSSTGGQRNISVAHKFASPQKGTFSIWLYDVAPGQQTQYQQIQLYNSATSDYASVGTQDFDAFCYEAQLCNANTRRQQGPDQNCGIIYPQISTTSVRRTPGWHNLSIFVASDSITLAIDGQAVFTSVGSYSYDTATLFQSGPYWRPNTYSYWDDFAAPIWKAN